VRVERLEVTVERDQPMGGVVLVAGPQDEA
jgi:hypothetical protein